MGEGSGRTGEAALLVTGGMALFGLIDNFMRLAAPGRGGCGSSISCARLWPWRFSCPLPGCSARR